MRKLLVVVFVFTFFNHSFSQTATIRGTVKDGKTGELLESANVVQPPSNGTTTDAKGNYELKVTPGKFSLIIRYVGMTADTEQISIKDGETKTLHITLGGNPVELQTVVIGENKIGIKLQKVTQSVDVMKPRMLENNNITNLQQAVMKIPGVTVLDGQMSIRGGSGYAYGSGSRVMLVVDEMPLMTADRGEIRWPLIPIENIEQMELMKGASTVQYGSSALNGVLNVTTAYARDTPNTRFTFYYEGIGKPPVDSFRWWKRDGKFFENPNMLGMTFSHKQKFGDVDFVIGGAMQGYQSHLNHEYEQYVRYNAKLRWQPKKLQRLTLELVLHVMYRKSGFQFYWQDMQHPYISAPGVNLDERYFYAFIDPKFRFIDKKNNQHKIYTRINRQKNMDGVTNFWVFRLDYQFRHDFGKIFRLLLGVNNEHYTVKDGTLGIHNGDLGGGFVQGELNYKWFTLNGGVREEYVHIDSAITPTIPVFRAGVNFEIRKFNYIRASFGQAFRVPSLAERYVRYTLGQINIIPNDTIKPEKGYTLELGYKRSIKIGKWLGYIDAVAFWTQFKDMVEFQFGSYSLNVPPYYFAYFQSQNVAKARVFGWEISAYGEGKFGPVDFTTLLGWTYFYGVDLNDSTYGANKRNNNIGTFLLDAFRKIAVPTPVDSAGGSLAASNTWDSLTAGMLKYRTPHLVKADFDFIFYNRYHFGTSLQFYSYMMKVDKIFEAVIPGVAETRELRRNKGDFVWDLRAGFDFNRNVSLNLLVKNVLNQNYAIRIARPDKPRSYTVQLIVNFGAMPKRNTPVPAAGASY